MFRFEAEKSVEFCDGLRRRDFLHAGSLALLGLSLTDFFRLKLLGSVSQTKDINCIFLFLVGGAGQMDTWDPKPEAPAEIRGPFKAIPTNVPGIQLSELFPKMSRLVDKFALVRSVYYNGAPTHEIGHQIAQTGRIFQGGLEHPHLGCALSYVKGPRQNMPPHVLLPYAIGNTGVSIPHGQSAGYLGKTYDPFILNADPSTPNFRVPDMLPPRELSPIRVSQRMQLRQMVDQAVSQFEGSQEARLMDTAFEKAYALATSEEARNAFQLADEPEATREKYGKNRFGQSCLLARRLVEHGVRFATVNMFDTVFNEITWDCHGVRPFCGLGGYKELLGPTFDKAFSALLEDLSDRGLLENTLVVATGEFGRTPKINTSGGRDHWPGCWTVLLAGGGVKGGQVVGSSDEIGSAPKDRPVSAAEVVATIYHALGINLDTEFTALQNRPVRIVDHGVEPVTELF